ncbi:MAG: tetratricopeptide repeat protein [Candidatus Rokubacteria bacterium]|nr:tetratricopeptide repeat protein [Candidatus Rokubacteria bacterium]
MTPHRRRSLPAAVPLLLLLVGPATAAAPPLELPPPELSAALRWTAPPTEKPAIPLPGVALPAPPDALPPLPTPKLVTDPALRPIAPLGPPRALACNPLGSVFGVATELLECGKARFQRGEYGDARDAFQSVVNRGSDRAVVREGRYWLAETSLRMGRPDLADPLLTLVVQEGTAGELGSSANHALGWLALERGVPARALQIFEPMLKGSMPVDLVPYAQHGRALALYGLGRYADARDAWLHLLNQRVPRPVAAEGMFWLGDSLGRLGDYPGAVSRLQSFTAAGPQFLIEPGLFRLGWWTRAAGQPLDAVKVYRGLLAAYPKTAEEPWARVGLVQALVDLGDPDAARQEAKRLEPLDPTGNLSLPVQVLIAQAAVAGKHPEAGAITRELLARRLSPATRGHVLLLSAEAQRQAGQTVEARGQLDAVRANPGRPDVARHAGLLLGQMNLEARDFNEARAAAEGLLRESSPPLSPELRAAALILAGEAGYWSRQYEGAAASYGRFLTELPQRPERAQVAFSLGWAELRRGRAAAARESWERLARDFPSDPLVPTALILAAEMAAGAGDRAGALALLDRVLTGFPAHQHAEVARLNRAMLSLGAGRAPDALRDVSDLITRSPSSPYAGPMRLIRGMALIGAGRPAEARADLEAGLRAGAGEGAAHLGLGRIAFDDKQWDEAAREFELARDTGGGPVAAAAEYGLAATYFNQGKKAEFKQLAPGLLSGSRDRTLTPPLLEGLAALAAEDKNWTEARTLTVRLASDFPDTPAAPRALARLGEAASREGQWPLAREAYQLLAARHPSSAETQAADVDLSEALLRTGAAPEARRRLQTFVDTRKGDPAMPRALLLLAQAQETAGDRPAALQTYARLGQDYPNAQGGAAAALAQGRLLQRDGRWDEARPLLEKALDASDAAGAAEAAFELGEGHRRANQLQDAVDAYMLAAYLVPDTPTGHRALLEAGQSLAALKQKGAAVTVYKKLLASSGVAPDVTDSAKRALQALGPS